MRSRHETSILSETGRPWRVPLADVVVTDEDIAAVVDAYRSGWLSMGPRTEEFEDRFAAFAGARHALAVASGTAALHLACLAAGFGPGDEVLVPAMTFVATVNAIAYTGARPVFVEIEGVREPWLSAESAADAVGPHTAGIVTVSYGGHPGETLRLRDLAQRNGLILIEDAAHAVGTRIGGKHAGTFGAMGAFSFFSNKNLAVGEAGMVVTNDDALAQQLRLLRSHGMTTLTWDRHRGHAASYDVLALGFNYRIDEPRAAFGLVRLKRLDDENENRRRIIAAYRNKLHGIAGLSAISEPPPDVTSSAHLFPIVVDEDIDRDAFRLSVGSAGVQTSVHYPPAHRFSLYRSIERHLPLTEAYGRRTVTLPLFPHMAAEDVDLVIDAVARAPRDSRRNIQRG